jgi:hypothetical protein
MELKLNNLLNCNPLFTTTFNNAIHELNNWLCFWHFHVKQWGCFKLQILPNLYHLLLFFVPCWFQKSYDEWKYWIHTIFMSNSFMKKGVKGETPKKTLQCNKVKQ